MQLIQQTETRPMHSDRLKLNDTLNRRLVGMDLTHFDFRGLRAVNLKLVMCNLDFVDFSDAFLPGLQLDECTWKPLKAPIFDGATLWGAKIRPCEPATQIADTINTVTPQPRHATQNLGSYRQADLTGAVFVGKLPMCGPQAAPPFGDNFYGACLLGTEYQTANQTFTEPLRMSGDYAVPEYVMHRSYVQSLVSQVELDMSAWRGFSPERIAQLVRRAAATDWHLDKSAGARTDGLTAVRMVRRMVHLFTKRELLDCFPPDLARIAAGEVSVAELKGLPDEVSPERVVAAQKARKAAALTTRMIANDPVRAKNTAMSIMPLDFLAAEAAMHNPLYDSVMSYHMFYAVPQLMAMRGGIEAATGQDAMREFTRFWRTKLGIGTPRVKMRQYKQCIGPVVKARITSTSTVTGRPTARGHNRFEEALKFDKLLVEARASVDAQDRACVVGLHVKNLAGPFDASRLSFKGCKFDNCDLFMWDLNGTEFEDCDLSNCHMGRIRPTDMRDFGAALEDIMPGIKKNRLPVWRDKPRFVRCQLHLLRVSRIKPHELASVWDMVGCKMPVEHSDEYRAKLKPRGRRSTVADTIADNSADNSADTNAYSQTYQD